MQGTFTIEVEIDERDFMEQMMNLRHAGYDPMVHIAFYAFAKSWKLDKLVYYLDMVKAG